MILLIFLSTLSLRRATGNIADSVQHIQNFYPRSPCGERRSQSCRCDCSTADFYPRSPCGERRSPVLQIYWLLLLFLSTLSLRRATKSRMQYYVTTHISIHALLAESDSPVLQIYWLLPLFLSTLSLRRATSKTGSAANSSSDFYPRSPCGERPSNFANLR